MFVSMIFFLSPIRIFAYYYHGYPIIIITVSSHVNYKLFMAAHYNILRWGEHWAAIEFDTMVHYKDVIIHLAVLVATFSTYWPTGHYKF